MFKDDLLQLFRLESVIVVDKYMIVNRSSCTFDGNVGVEVEIELERMSTTGLNKRAWNWVAILVGLTSRSLKEANTVTLCSDDHSKVGYRCLWMRIESTTKSPHVFDFLIKDMVILTLGNTVANKKDALWELTTKLTNPLIHHLAQKLVDVFRCNHFNAMTVGFTLSGIASVVLIHRTSDCRH